MCFTAKYYLTMNTFLKKKYYQIFTVKIGNKMTENLY